MKIKKCKKAFLKIGLPVAAALIIAGIKILSEKKKHCHK